MLGISIDEIITYQSAVILRPILLQIVCRKGSDLDINLSKGERSLRLHSHGFWKLTAESDQCPSHLALNCYVTTECLAGKGMLCSIRWKSWKCAQTAAEFSIGFDLPLEFYSHCCVLKVGCCLHSTRETVSHGVLKILGGKLKMAFVLRNTSVKFVLLTSEQVCTIWLVTFGNGRRLFSP
jgi:hypothetical protein